MHRDPVESVLRSRLERHRFDFCRPSPHAAWAAFREFAALPLAGLTTITVGVEVLQVADRDDHLWLSFMRRLEEPSGVGWSCGCLLRRPCPALLEGVAESWWHWSEHGTLAQWAAEVEALPSFGRCLALEGWSWQGFSE